MPTARIVLWTGPKHSGKSTAAAALVRRARRCGFAVAGVLAEAVHDGGRRIGFDVVDLRTGARAALARRGGEGPQTAGSYAFAGEGLTLGAEALRAAAGADLVIVDEFGPLELSGGGWREAVEELVVRARGVLLLVVRAELAGKVRRLWPGAEPAVVRASAEGACASVLALLRADGGETSCVGRG